MQSRPTSLSLIALFAIGCGSTVSPAENDAAPVVDSEVVEVSIDTSVADTSEPDTAPVHVPKAPRCVPADSGTDDGGPSPSDAEGSDAAADAATDAASDGEAGTAPGFFPPQVVSSGGPVLKHPRIVPITFDGDSNRDDIEDFVNSIGCTSYWSAIASEYGIHEAVGGAPIHVKDPAPDSITDSGIIKFLKTGLADKSLGWEQPTPDTVYAIFYPSNTTIKLGTQESCMAFGGYHKNFSFNGADVAYAVVPDCGGDMTGSASHEFIEAATDPFPFSNPGYQTTADDFVVYSYRFGGEVGDMCELIRNGGMFQPSDYPFIVQRSWSNKAAREGHDPCVPAQSSVYFNVSLELPDRVSFQGVDTRGLKLAVGESKTIYIDLYADGPMDEWNLSARDASGEPAHLSFSFDKTTGKAGDRIALTITKKSDSASLGGEPFSVVSSLGTGASSKRNVAYGVVGH